MPRKKSTNLPQRLPPQPTLPEALGALANQTAARHRFSDYQARHAANTLRRQKADLDLFAQFLSGLGLTPGDLFSSPDAWRAVTWGLVEGFVRWQLQLGYALPSVNVRLSSVKTYARLAMQSGTLSPQEYALIRAVQGYSQREQRRLDTRRPVKRVGLKKSAPVKIKLEQALQLKAQPDTPHGRRDTLLMCLLLDHGLRAGELAGLETDQLDLENATLRFFRPKVGKVQTHRLSPDTLRAAQACAERGELIPGGLLLRRTVKGGGLGAPGMSERAITERVRQLGEAAGLDRLSAHDCRHYWATTAARRGADPFALQEAGGWASLTMPRRYVAEREIANEGLVGDEDSA